MDMRNFRDFIRKRSTIWTLGLCMTGVVVLGGIAAVDSTRRAGEETQTRENADEYAFLDENAGELNDTLTGPLGEEQAESEDEEARLAASGEVTEDTAAGTEKQDAKADASEHPEERVSVSADGQNAGDASGTEYDQTVSGESLTAADRTSGSVTASSDDIAAIAAEAASGGVISEEVLHSAGIDFSGDEYLMWPSAGKILIDYSMDGSVYFPTLNQYKYNPALVIGSEAGNQVLAAARGIVEKVYTDEETGITVVMNIGNGYRLTYGQLMELAVEQGDLVEEGSVIGYISQPTKYYSREGSNLYFAMTQGGHAVDPVQYLE